MLLIRIHSCNNLQTRVEIDLPSITRLITYDFLNQTNSLRCVRLVEEKYRRGRRVIALEAACRKQLGPISSRQFLGLLNFSADLFRRRTAVHLHVNEMLRCHNIRTQVQITQELDHSCLATASLAHDHYRVIAAPAHVDCHEFKARVQIDLIRLVRIEAHLVGLVKAHHDSQAVNFFSARKVVEILENGHTLGEESYAHSGLELELWQQDRLACVGIDEGVAPAVQVDSHEGEGLAVGVEDYVGVVEVLPFAGDFKAVYGYLNLF